MMFSKAVAYFEVIEKTYIDTTLKYIDTTSTKGKIKHDILLTEKEDLLEIALEGFNKFIDSFPKSNLYPKALYNLAHISSLLQYDEDEISYLKKLLESNADDRDHSGRNGLMANPYANYKHDASNRLTEIFIKKGDFKNALKYKKVSEKYPLQHFCGNAFAAEEIHNAQIYGEIYNGLGNSDKALHYLLPHVFGNGFASNDKLVQTTIDILKKNSDSKTLKSSLENAMNNFYSKKVNLNNDEWTNYYIHLFDTEIEVPSWGIFEDDSEKIKAIVFKRIKESHFYKLLNE